jgi:hypothetical protein
MARTYKAGVLITGDSKGAVKAVNLTSKEVENLNKSTSKSVKATADFAKKTGAAFSNIAQQAAKLGAVVGVAGAAIGTSLVRAGLESVDSLAKVSMRLGIATEDLASLRFAAEQTGVSTDTLDMALQRMTRRVAEAANGTGEARGALEELGLSAKALNELSPDQTFRRVTEAMEGVGNQSDKVRLAMKLFDSEGVSLVQTMAAGTEGLNQFAREAEIAGLAISSFDASKVEAANDSINRVRTTFQGFGQQLAVNFAPVIEGVANAFFGVAKEAGGTATAADKAFSFIVRAAGQVANAIRGLEVGWNLFKLAFQEAALFVVQGFDKIRMAAAELWNKLPWVDKMEVDRTQSAFLLTLEANVRQTKDTIDDLLRQPLPSDGIESFVDEATRQFNEYAQVGTDSAEMIGMANEEALSSVADTASQIPEEVAKAANAAADESAKAAVRQESAWDKALQGTVERIDQAFATAWKGGFDSFSDFRDNIKDAFKNLLGEMANLAITRPIVMSIGAAFGMGGSGSAAASGIGSLFGGGGGAGGGGLLSGFGNIGSGLFNSIGQGASFLADLGIPGMDSLSTAAFGKGMTITGGGALASGLAGIGGGLLGNKVFGETSGIGSTIGGIGGTIFGGPIGSAIGSFLGSGLESLLSGKPSDKTGTALLDTSTGSIQIGGLTGSKFSQENRDAAQQIAQELSQIAGGIGGSNAVLDIGVGNRDGLRLNGVDFGSDQAGFFAEAFDRILESATNLDPVVKQLAMAFDGTTEQTVEFIRSMQGLFSSIESNPVDQAIADFSTATEQAESSLRSSYDSIVSNLNGVVASFDGSQASVVALGNALAENRQAAYDFALAIQAVGAQISDIIGNSISRFEEVGLSEEEIRRRNTQRRDSLRAELDTATSPERIAEIVREIDSLTNSLFNSLDASAQNQASAQSAIDFLAETERVAQNQLENSLRAIQDQQSALNQEIEAVLRGAANQQQQAANTMLAAANTLSGAANQFSSTSFDLGAQVGI